jgi:hypothetical protein
VITTDPFALTKVARIVHAPGKGSTPLDSEALPRARTGQVSDPLRLGDVQVTSPEVDLLAKVRVRAPGRDPLRRVTTAGEVTID